MSDARALLQAGDPRVALDKLKQEVRKAPGDAKLRTFLFQMFCVTGEWDRAVTQLQVVGELDKLALPMCTAYHAAIGCEMLRARIFAGERLPTIFGEPEPWMSLLIEANKRLAAGAPEDAARLRDEAFETAPTTAGSANGAPFDWIADADPRLGPMLEALIDGKYYWVPFHRLKAVKVEPPVDLRDLVWLPAELTFTNGGGTVAMLPARYPGTEASTDPALLLGRRTEWREVGEWFLGIGQRMLTTGDEEDVPLLELRHLTFAHPVEAMPAASDEPPA